MYLLYDFPTFEKEYAKHVLKSVKKKGTFYIHKDCNDYKNYIKKKCPKLTFETVSTLKNCKVLEKKYKTFTFADVYSDLEYAKYFCESTIKAPLNSLEHLKPIEYIYGLNSTGKTLKLKELEASLINYQNDLYTCYKPVFINKSLDEWFDCLCYGRLEMESKLLHSLEKQSKQLNKDIAFTKGQLVSSKVSSNDIEVDLCSKDLIQSSLKQYQSQEYELNKQLRGLNNNLTTESTGIPWDIPGLHFSESFDLMKASEMTGQKELLSSLYHNTLTHHQAVKDLYTTQLKFVTTRVKKLEKQAQAIQNSEQQEVDTNHLLELIKKLQDQLKLVTHFKKKVKSGHYKKELVLDHVNNIIQDINRLDIATIKYSVNCKEKSIIIKNDTFNSTHFSNFEILLFELAARFSLQQDLLLMDETMDIIHESLMFKQLLELFPFKHYIIVTHRLDFIQA